MKALEDLEVAFAALQERGSPLILLRERAFDAATASSEGDYDLLAPSGDFDGVVAALLEGFLERRTSVQVHYSKPEKRLIVLYDPEADRSIEIDLWREHRIDVPANGAPLHTRLLLHSSLAPHCEARGQVLRMAPWLELAVYLCHLYEKKKDLSSAGVRERLLFYGAFDFQGTRCPPDLLEHLQRAPEGILEGRMDASGAAALGAAVLERLGLLDGAPSRREAWRWWWLRRRRSVARRLGAGPVVAVQGPDGAGKTTIIDALQAQPVVFKRLYRRSVFRWLYKLVRKLRRLRNRAEPKEVVEVALSPFLFVGALMSYRFLRFLQLLRARGKMIVFDRFFPDLLVTNRKDEAADLTFTGSARWLERLVPRCDCAVLLAASAEVLRARKAEMSDENTRLYLRAMIEHFTRRPPANLLLLRTDIRLERSLAIFKKALERVR